MKFLVPILTLAILGCKVSGMSISKDVDYRDVGPFKAGLAWRAGCAMTYYKPDLEEKNVPVHPDDSGFLSGDTTVKADGGMEYQTLSFGAEVMAGDDDYCFTGGLDLQFAFSRYIDSATTTFWGIDKSGMFDYEKQISDTRPDNSASFVYDKVDLPFISPVPFVGFRAHSDDISFSAELGFAYKQFRREWGHHRYDEEDPVGRESDGGWSLRPSVGVAFRLSDSGSMPLVGLDVSYERYTLDFGSIKGVTVLVYLAGWDF